MVNDGQNEHRSQTFQDAQSFQAKLIRLWASIDDDDGDDDDDGCDDDLALRVHSHPKKERRR